MPLQLELLVNNDPRVLTAVRAFAREALRQVPLAAPQTAKLAELIERSAHAAIKEAYPAGEDGSIRLQIAESQGKVVVTVRDYGMPQDVAMLERQLHQPDCPQARLFGMPSREIADEIHWLNYGPEGKALQLTIWLHNEPISIQALETFREDAPLAPMQTYRVQRMVAGQSIQVSQLIYRAYGGTYFNRDVYYPERVAVQNERGDVLSFVAEGEAGRLVGHYALERNQPGPVAEGGQAVVDPAHRGRGLLARMKEAAVDAARQRGLVGIYADAVTVHTLTQKSNVDHGAHLACVDLGIAPKTEHFHRLSEEQSQRVTCLLYFLWLQPTELRTVYVPSTHRDIVDEIYHSLKCPVTFGAEATPQGHGTLTVKIDTAAGTAFIRADALGEDSVSAVCHAKRELIEHSHAQVLFVELPLQHPGTPPVVSELEGHGFGFAGVAPHFSTRGDLLRLVYVVDPLKREPIQTYEDFAGRLVDYVLAEQERVRGSI